MTAATASSRNTGTYLLHDLTSRKTLILTDRHEKLKSPKRLSYIKKTETTFIVIH